MQIHISRTGVSEGPFPIEQVRQMLASGDLKPTDHVFHEGITEWVKRLVPALLAVTIAPC